MIKDVVGLCKLCSCFLASAFSRLQSSSLRVSSSVAKAERDASGKGPKGPRPQREGGRGRVPVARRKNRSEVGGLFLSGN